MQNHYEIIQKVVFDPKRAKLFQFGPVRTSPVAVQESRTCSVAVQTWAALSSGCVSVSVSVSVHLCVCMSVPLCLCVCTRVFAYVCIDIGLCVQSISHLCVCMCVLEGVEYVYKFMHACVLVTCSHFLGGPGPGSRFGAFRPA